jgi:sodium/hydrogen antiporter
LKQGSDQVILGTIIGTLIGLGFCHLMKFSQGKGFIDQESFVAQYLALTFLTIGICSTLGVDDLLAAFAAGALDCAVTNIHIT